MNKILLIMQPQRRRKLEDYLSNSGFEVLGVQNAEEGSRMLTEPFHFDLVLVDAELPDGSWRDLLPFVLSSPKPSEMVVCSRCGEEELWAEVLQCGVYDLIPEPYEHPETLRIIRNALDTQYLRRFRFPGHAIAS